MERPPQDERCGETSPREGVSPVHAPVPEAPGIDAYPRRRSLEPTRHWTSCTWHPPSRGEMTILGTQALLTCHLADLSLIMGAERRKNVISLSDWLLVLIVKHTVLTLLYLGYFMSGHIFPLSKFRDLCADLSKAVQRPGGKHVPESSLPHRDWLHERVKHRPFAQLQAMVTAPLRVASPWDFLCAWQRTPRLSLLGSASQKFRAGLKQRDHLGNEGCSAKTCQVCHAMLARSWHGFKEVSTSLKTVGHSWRLTMLGVQYQSRCMSSCI